MSVIDFVVLATVTGLFIYYAHITPKGRVRTLFVWVAIFYIVLMFVASYPTIKHFVQPYITIEKTR